MTTTEIIQEKHFSDIDPNIFGIVILGAGGELQDWVDGITKELLKAKIIEPLKGDLLFSDAYKVSGNIRGKEGRTDIVLIFNPEIVLEMGKLAIWRLGWSGTISWIDDFKDNYKKDYR
jgi:hypothetical protein